MQPNLIDSNLATKADLRETELRILKWVMAMLLAQTGIIIAIIKLLG